MNIWLIQEKPASSYSWHGHNKLVLNILKLKNSKSGMIVHLDFSPTSQSQGILTDQKRVMSFNKMNMDLKQVEIETNFYNW